MKLIEALQIIAKAPAAEPLPVALVCGFTPLHLQTYVHAHLQQRHPRHKITMRTGLYGDLTGSLAALAHEGGAAVVVVEWPDVDERLGVRQLGGWGPQQLPEIIEQSRRRLVRWQQAIEQATGTQIALSLPTLPLPPLFHTAGWQASAAELQLRQAMAEFGAWAAAQPRVRVVSAQRLDRVSPPAERHDLKSEVTNGFPYKQPHAEALAGLLATLLQSTAPKKGLITDLDNTLWDGIVGDAGAQGVTWDLDHKTQAHGLYQQMLKTLSEEGVLVGIASKNDPRNVDEAFERTDLLLPRERVFPFEVSWGSKAKAMERILQVWNIGADSVVFVDDNPIELAEVQAAHPTVECLLFPHRDPQGVYDLLQTLRDRFGKPRLSEEDALRLASIRNSSTLREGSGDENSGFSEDLLAQANAELTLRFAKDPQDQRAFELINKTNQFNLNGERFAEVDWQNFLRDPDSFLVTASYQDRFGALGRIAVLGGRRHNGSLHINTWVMSCRAFARRIEHQCLRALYEHFQPQEIEFAYKPTAKNGPTAQFFKELRGDTPQSGFALTRESFDAACPALHHRVTEIDQ